MIIRNNFKRFENIKKILVVQLGDIGDVVNSVPALHSIKEAYPKASISVLTRESFGSLLDADKCIDEIFGVELRQGNVITRELPQIALIARLRNKKFDLVFDLRSDERGAFMAFASGAPIRAGLFYGRHQFWRNHALTHLFNIDTTKEASTAGASEQSLRIIRGFDIPATEEIPKLFVAPDAQVEIEEMINDNGLHQQKWISINPFSRWHHKEWSLTKWAQTIDWLVENKKVVCVIVGASNDSKRTQELIMQTRHKPLDFVGKTTLPQLVALLSRSATHIGVDSAAAHIAGAVGTPTFTIFGPTDWQSWGPLGKDNHFLFPVRDCYPCYKKGCDDSGGQSCCLDELDVSTVINRLQELI
ncbi:MAG: glycosyltransferase family 9 protein [Deltaproteobacteria bacterium]